MRALAVVLAVAVLAPALPLVAANHPALVPSVLGPQRAAPIVVEGDAGFLLPADVSGVRSGLGSPGDPFRIEGWSIVSLPFNPSIGNLGYSNVWLPCILLQNTQAHVVIRDNFIRGNNCHGVWLQNASNVVVERNIIQHNTGHGVLVEAFGPPSAGHVGRDIVVQDNAIRSNGFDGIRVFYAKDVVVQRNTLVANANFGLLARESDGVVVRGNTADYNEVSGLFIELSDRARIEGNTARWNVIGIDLEMQMDSMVRGNVARGNRDVGIYASEMSMNNFIEYNLVEENGLGQANGWNDGIADSSTMNSIRYNTVRGNRDGISLSGVSVDVEVWWNLVEGNERGIVLEACPCEVEENTVRGNGIGIEATVPSCDWVRYNNLSGNALGARSTAGSLEMLHNWWGSPDGPAPFGTGDAVEGLVLVDPWSEAPIPGTP